MARSETLIKADTLVFKGANTMLETENVDITIGDFIMRGIIEHDSVFVPLLAKLVKNDPTIGLLDANISLPSLYYALRMSMASKAPLVPW